ncbi:hypothetical protein ASPZODRAFT_17135 [Penicilliopsis zonata CBS 506.65]|uniref:Uncharacterized protein n=1 Tax=Penicilliopsis zonata CBS 506.65 TaxID=1073090 RepID=A0A1L9SEQ4_9EURO|nr:hypothetical protein ASPZODRAFT_17135 [Penicilliopsis zonata CBS 506.65]OJJ45686.1 hypothetical protein ASPZODRAFT_17135 [Penicilliopsis zonata CBS 506.65]
MDTRANRLRRQAKLRSKYETAAESILESFLLEPKKSFSSCDLARLGIDLMPFDPFDQDFLQSRKCLFKPLPKDVLAEYFIDPSELLDGDHTALKWLEHPSSSVNLSSPLRAAVTIFSYLETTYLHLQRKTPKGYLFEVAKWQFIMCDDDFHDANGFYNHPFPSPMPVWSYLYMMQHCTEQGGKLITLPHLQLIMGNDAVPKENEILPGELGPIVQGILARLNQPDFDHTSLFPVQMLSLFGPRDGRILQARFYPSGRLVIRATQIYRFERHNQDDLATLFLRFWLSEPCIGDEYEFYVDEESPGGLPQAVIALSSTSVVKAKQVSHAYS